MNEDITIDLKDLLYRVLLKWRLLLVACIAGALLGDLVGILKDYKAVREAGSVSTVEEQENLESLVKEKEAALTDNELYDAQAALTNYSLYRSEYENLDKYVKNSIYLSLNSQSVPVYSYYYMVEGDVKAEYPVISLKDHSGDLADIYRAVAESDEYLLKAAELLGSSTEYAAELVKVSSHTDPSDATFKVSFLGKDREMCEELAKAFDECIDLKTKELESQFKDYTLVKHSADFTYAIDDELKGRQQGVANDMSSFRYNWLHVTDVLGEAQREYYDAVRQLSDEEKKGAGDEGISSTETEETAVSMPTVSYVHKKLMLIGFVGMAFLVCFIIAMMYILMPVVRVKENITDGFGQPVLGTVWKSTESKAFLGSIDDWLTKLFYGRECSYELKKRVNMLCAGIKIQIEKEGYDNLYITGASDGNKDLVKELVSGLSKSGKVASGDSVVYDAKSLEKLSDSASVLFVETAGDSRYDEVAKELELARQSKVPVLGFILQQQR